MSGLPRSSIGTLLAISRSSSSCSPFASTEDYQKNFFNTLKLQLVFLRFFVSFLEKVAKRWPRLGYKRKKILRFHSFRVTCKISLVPGTGLEPAHLSIHAPETCASTNSAIRASGRIPNHLESVVGIASDCRQLFPLFWCPGQDLNLHALIGTTPSK